MVARRACLLTIRGRDLGRNYSCIESGLGIGSASDAHVHLPDERSLMPVEAMVQYRGSNWALLPSPNSTLRWIVRQRLGDLLTSGDVLEFGTTRLKFLSEPDLEDKYHREISALAESREAPETSDS